MPASKLHHQKLPSYTTERYYVLSEIEQVATFKSTEEVEGSAGNMDEGVTTSSTKEGKKNFYYLLWDLHNGGLGTFKKDMTLLCASMEATNKSTKESSSPSAPDDSSPLSGASTFLAVEVMASKESQDNLVKMLTQSDYEGQHDIAEAYAWVEKSFDFDLVVFGTCDKTSGTPAIELLQNLVSFSFTDIYPSNLVIHALTIDAFLGHDANREPDADSDVTQALFLSRPYAPPPRDASKIDFSQQPPYFHAIVFGFLGAVVLMYGAILLSGTTQPLTPWGAKAAAEAEFEFDL